MATAHRLTTAAETARAEIEAYLDATSRKSLLRFITCGSVDDGKSTLIGRLLYDSKMLFEDQLDALASDSKRSGTQGEALDLALLVDGLAAEREQGITIDVAYRFFTTEKRKFIVADTPGHEQYTRNMVTGASTADLAVILIDARKGVLTQTRRHSFLVHLLGIRNVVLAVNKMDLVGFDQARFDEIVADYRAFADEIGISGFTAIPVSGLNGDNVTTRSDAMPWYRGPALLEHLETVPVESAAQADEPFRMAVQWVNRPNQNFRGYAGRIASGRIRVGDTVSVLPAGRRSQVARIVTFDGDLAEAVAGQSVTLTLTDEVDCSRGDIIASAAAEPEPVSRLEATLVWMSDEAMVPHRSYWLKIGSQTVSAAIGGMGPIVDVNTMEQRRGLTLALNDIGQVDIDLDRRIPAVLYADNRRLGGFILIDKVTHATVAAGLVQGFPKSVLKTADHHEADKGSILWIAGAGRSAHAARAAESLAALGRPAFVLDEAAIADLVSDLGANAEAERIRRAREVARLMARAGVHVLVTLEAAPEEAQPGRRIEAGTNEDEGAGEWVI
ncbi:sulfate adenylyltransferase subunit CysN [Sphingosinicella sp. BN140058]|uniref:sulfate adenylyltransferase subunit CysN n=1 Tax=Sphingosinicella sp. BN140058 TaxID=1892855 RepID=UPI001012C10F|nr:sulfate adenylyltransferase subunit CysN [Sphingosinicella sp. BN140058]QAY77268.1 sulfate adenylyltransferase subunit CysN [Sphingosinicella sp. BN140058]